MSPLRVFAPFAASLFLVAPLPAQVYGPPSPPSPILRGAEPSWEDWWWFNRADFLAWPSRGDGGSRSGLASAKTREKVVSALLAELGEDAESAVRRQVLMALGRIGDPGEDAAGWGVRAAIERELVHPERGVHQAAVLALGVLGEASSVETLLAILGDDEEARRILDTTEPVEYSTRSFAAYALGLLGEQAEDPGLQERIAAALWRTYSEPDVEGHDLGTAAVIAIGLVPLERGDSREGQPVEAAQPPRTLQEQIRHLLAFACDEESRQGRPVTRSHAARAVTRLLAGAPELREEVARSLFPFVTKRGNVGDRFVRTGASIALGFVGDLDDDDLDARIRDALWAATSNFSFGVKTESLCAFGRVGRRPGRSGTPIAGAEKLEERLWMAALKGRWRIQPISLLSVVAMKPTLEANGVVVADRFSKYTRTLLREPEGDVRAALSIALGLLGDRESAASLAEDLSDSAADPLNGYLALGLALMGDESAGVLAGRIIDDPLASVECREQAALAAARTGDLELAGKMLARLSDVRSRETCRALASGLSHFDDPRLVDPLIELLRDSELPVVAREHAAAILGHLCARRARPWEEKLRIGLMYYLAPATLTEHGGSGVLDFP